MYDTKTVHMVKHIYTQQMTNSTCRTQITDHGGGLSVCIHNHIQHVTLKLAPITHGCLSQKEEIQWKYPPCVWVSSFLHRHFSDCTILFTSLFFFLLSLFVTVYIFLHLTAMCIRFFGVGGWVRAVCILWYECFLVVFSLQELACMHCVYLAL